jgi:hypothetical protein
MGPPYWHTTAKSIGKPVNMRSTRRPRPALQKALLGTALQLIDLVQALNPMLAQVRKPAKRLYPVLFNSVDLRPSTRAKHRV